MANLNLQLKDQFWFADIFKAEDSTCLKKRKPTQLFYRYYESRNRQQIQGESSRFRGSGEIGRLSIGVEVVKSFGLQSMKEML